MDTKMSQKTREEVLEKLRPRYARAGKEHKGKIIDEVVQLFGYHRKAALRGTLLMQQIPIRAEWAVEEPGFLEMDTVALCGGVLDDRHVWMFDAVDIQTTWNELRALPNRGEKATLEQIQGVEDHLPFPLRGVDSDNGG